jgi:hypothetical protein
MPAPRSFRVRPPIIGTSDRDGRAMSSAVHRLYFKSLRFYLARIFTPEPVIVDDLYSLVLFFALSSKSLIDCFVWSVLLFHHFAMALSWKPSAPALCIASAVHSQEYEVLITSSRHGTALKSTLDISLPTATRPPSEVLPKDTITDRGVIAGPDTTREAIFPALGTTSEADFCPRNG